MILNPSEGVAVTTEELISLHYRAQQFKLPTQTPSRAGLVGGRQSRFRGRGVDYQESRTYQPGDDIRTMDWRVTARTGRPHTKIYQEERERPVIAVVDFNPSMFFGTKVAFKSVTAARLAALLGWVITYHGDRIGALLFAAERHQELPPTGGRNGALALVRALVRWADPSDGGGFASADGSLAHALKRLRRLARPGTMIFLISDFYTLDTEIEQHLTGLRQHNDVVAYHIIDVIEQTPPPPGIYGITDGRKMQWLDSRPATLRERYNAMLTERRRKLLALLNKLAIPLLTATTDGDLSANLRQGLTAICR